MDQLDFLVSNYRLILRTKVGTFSTRIFKHKNLIKGGTSIAQWICLHLPSCRPGFESQKHHLRFYHLKSNLCYICHVKKERKINKKRIGLAHLKNNLINKDTVVASISDNANRILHPLLREPNINNKIKV